MKGRLFTCASDCRQRFFELLSRIDAEQEPQFTMKNMKDMKR